MAKNTFREKALKAFREAVREVIEEHRRSGRKLAVWRNGRVMKISASQALKRAR